MDLSRLHSVQVVTPTAFDAAGRLNLAPMQQLFERLLEAGVRALIPAAGSAEFHSLDADEIVRIVQAVRHVAGTAAAVMAPTGLRLDFAISVAQRCRDAGADAILVMPLNFPYLSDEGARDYYCRLLDTVEAPFLLYKRGPFPSDSLLLELAEHPHLVGVKYAVNDMDAFRQVVVQDAGRIDWYCGTAERFAPYYALAGAPGYTSGAGNLCPRLTLAMHTALQRDQWRAAMQLQQEILPIEHYRARAGDSYNVSLLKHALAHTGLDFGQPRPPQRRLTIAEETEIEAIIDNVLRHERELT